MNSVFTSAMHGSRVPSSRLSVTGKIHICPEHTCVLLHSVIWGKYVACSPGSPSFTSWINAIYSNLWQLFERLILHFPMYKEVFYMEVEYSRKRNWFGKSDWFRSANGVDSVFFSSQHCAPGLVVRASLVTFSFCLFRNKNKFMERNFPCFLKKPYTIELIASPPLWFSILVFI